MGRIERQKSQLIEQANKKLLRESVHDNDSPVDGKPSPRFGSVPPIFISDVDKALYIVYNAMKKSNAEPEFLQWLSELGYTQEEMESEGKKIKNYIKQKIMDEAERNYIPNPFGPDGADIKVVVPVTAEEPLANINEAPIRRDIGSHEDMVKYGNNTKWWPASRNRGAKESYDGYVEKFGPFTVYISDDESIKVGCIGEDCYDQTDRMVSKEEAAQMLGVDSLDIIGGER